MEPSRFVQLIEDFEENIIVGGILKKRFSKKKILPTKDCKLANDTFGKCLGKTIKTDLVLVIDYYGYFKRSEGFLKKMKENGRPYPTKLKTSIVHFASVTMEDVSAMTDDVAVMLDFPRLKIEILILRGFRKRTY